MPRLKTYEHHVSDTLCARCRNGRVYQRRNGQRDAVCHVGADPVRVPLDIERCTDYEDRSTSDKWEMEKIAWVIRHDKSGKVAGFAPPEKDKDK